MLGLLIGLLGAVAAVLPWAWIVEENVGLGALFAVRGPVPPPGDVVIVGISRESAAAIGQTAELDTWSRGIHADLVDGLAAAGARAIVFDLLFSEPRDAAGDERFAAAIATAGNVLLFEGTDSEEQAAGIAWVEWGQPPLPAFRAGALGSAPFVLPTVPVRVGRFWTFGRAASDIPSLPVVALQALWLPQYDELLGLLERAQPGVTDGWPRSAAELEAGRNLELTVGSIRRAFESHSGLARAARRELERGDYAADSARALRALLEVYSGPPSRYLNLYGPARSVPTIRYDQALVGQGDVAGKVVFVGFSEPRQPAQADYFYSVFSEQTGINLSGVEIGATAFANLVDGRTLQTLPLPWHVLTILLLGAVFGTLVGGAAMRRAVVVLVGGAVLYVGVAYWLFAAHDVWLPLVVPLLVQMPVGFGVALWWNYREVAAQRERVRTALGYYVPRAVARRLAATTVATGANRQLLHGTCLVTDAEQYTAVAEKLRPDELAALMNDYYAVIFRVVQAYGGEVSDTAGDSMVAVWASAAPDPDARLRAARAGLAIIAAVEQFNAPRDTQRLPTRVGLESGQLVIGDIGAEQRYEYRAIGDIVNTAARIQALNQLLGTRVLVSGATIDGTAGLRTRAVGAFLLRGKRLPVEVHEPLADGAALDGDALAAFAAALAAFRMGSWQEAAERFAALAARFPGDGPSRYYAALAADCRREPPVEWRGAVRVDVK